MKKQSDMKPILFSTPMVQAILDGRKTMTRRIIKNPVPVAALNDNFKSEVICEDFAPQMVGDVLYVRETFAKTCIHPDGTCDGNDCDYCSWNYKADDPDAKFPGDWPNNTPKEQNPPKWKPSLFMPKAAARIFLRIIAVKAERLCDITGVDACREGIDSEYFNEVDEFIGGRLYANYAVKDAPLIYKDPANSFITLWDSINGKDAHKANPWVWAYTFERCDRPDSSLITHNS